MTLKNEAEKQREWKMRQGRETDEWEKEDVANKRKRSKE